MNLTLSIRSLNHEASGLRDGYATFAQLGGTVPLINETYITSSSRVITIIPAIASLIWFNVHSIVSNNQLNLWISYKSTVESEGISPALFSLNISFFPIDLTSVFGSKAKNSFALSMIISSGDFPDAVLETLG